jgi:UDP-N-acetylmuramate dehydrogenase
MDWLNGFDGRVENNVPLAPLTWFGVGGPAKHVVSPRGEAQLADLLRRAEAMGLPLTVLGGGANVLVRDDGVNGVVVRLDQDAFTRIDISGESLTSGGGVDLLTLCQRCVREGLAGLECLAGIPGTVGGAIRMNAGGRFGEIGNCIEWVRVMRPDGTIETRKRDQCGFGYRHSRLGSAVVMAVRFRLHREPRDEVAVRYREYWAYKKRSQPMSACSAGCVFKNPPGDSAGRLIDRAGLKGTRRGRARVSEQHANFIVAESGATASDVLQLVEHIRDVVWKKSGIKLELEIEIW